MSAGERASATALTRRDAFLLERYRAGEGELSTDTLRSPLARTLGQAMIAANGQGRDAALEAALADLTPATADGVKRALFAADIEGNEPSETCWARPDGGKDLTEMWRAGVDHRVSDIAG